MCFMNCLKSFFLLFEHLNDYHICLISLPFLLQEKNYKKVCNVFVSIALSMCLLVLLKGTLKIPHPKYSHTFAFPSGHAWMVLSVCYFLFKDKIKNYCIWTAVIMIIEFLVCLFGGHHNMTDMLGGLVLGLISIIFVELFNKYFNQSIFIRSGFALLFSIVVYLIIYYISNAKVYANNNIGGLLLYSMLAIIFCGIELASHKNKKFKRI